MDRVVYYKLFFVHFEIRKEGNCMNMQKGLFCILLLSFVVYMVGCKTTPPKIGYVPANEKVAEAFNIKDERDGIGNNDDEILPKVYKDVLYDIVYIDFEEDRGHTTKRVVLGYNVYGELIYNGERDGVDLIGRVFSNAGVPVGLGTVIASPLWGYLGQKTRKPDNFNLNVHAEGSGSGFATSN